MVFLKYLVFEKLENDSLSLKKKGREKSKSTKKTEKKKFRAEKKK